MSHALPAPALPPACFSLAGRLPGDLVARTARLPDAATQALAELLPLLGCGEEAAALAFDGLSEAHGDTVARAALRRIGDEERVHDRLLREMRAALPPPRDAGGLLRAARRFHIRLQHGGSTAHLARIAALDSAVCTMLSRLLRPRAPLLADPWIAGVLARIRRDEAEHVRVSRTLAAGRADVGCLRDLAAPARVALADILALAGNAFETLGVDTRALHRDCAALPAGLFA